MFAFSGSLRSIWGLSFLLVALVFLSGCHNASGVSTILVQEKDNVFKRIAVLPFQQIDAETAAGMAVAAVPVTVIKPKNDEGTPERIVQDLFWEGLTINNRFDLVSPDRTGGIFEQIVSTSFKVTMPEAIKRVGRELDADGLVIGYVYRFQERRGYDYSVEKPASVFFEIQLYRCSDGAVVWRGIFDKAQTSLMENVFRASYFFKDRGRWITARELAKEGIYDTLKKFPGLP